MTHPRRCLGDLIAALVDGELDHETRERVQGHVAGCPGCRSELAAQRGLKSLLQSSPALPAPAGLTARLLDLAVPGVGIRTDVVRGAPRALAARPVGVRPVAVRPVTVRPPVRSGRSRRRRTAVGGCLLALSLGAAVALGGPRGQGPVVPVDPSTDVFVVDYSGTTAELPAATVASVTGATEGARGGASRASR